MTDPYPPGPDGPPPPPPDPPIQAYQPPQLHQAYQPYQPPQPYQQPPPYQQPQPYQAAPPYQAPPPYGHYPYPVARVTEPLAVAAMIVSFVALAGLCLYGLGGVIGIAGAVLGHNARRRIRQTGAAGDGIALTGIIVSWITVGIAVVALVAFIVGAATST
jgi:hypothetical protein